MKDTLRDENIGPGKIELGGEGMGVPDERLLYIRASELARIRGRSSAEPSDFEEALRELTGVTTVPESNALLAPKAGVGQSQWDTLVQDLCNGAPDGSPATSGSEALKWEEEDEQAVPEQLVEEGMAEADHQQRLAASESLEQREREEGDVI